MRRRLAIGLFCTAAMLLTGCSRAPLDSVRVTSDPDGADRRTATFDMPVRVTEVTVRQIEDGTGEDIQDGDAVLLRMDLFKGSDGTRIDAPFAGGPGQVVTLDDDFRQQVPELHAALLESDVGDVLAYSSPQTDGAAGDDSTAVEIYEVAVRVPRELTGRDHASPAGLPEVTVDAEGVPTVGPLTGEAPETVTTGYLIEGDGPVVQPDDTVVIDYTGLRWADGEVVDATHGQGAPAAVRLDQVNPGWQEALVGKKTGSRLVVSVPAEKAYGAAGEGAGGEKPVPTDDLLFVIDLLARA